MSASAADVNSLSSELNKLSHETNRNSKIHLKQNTSDREPPDGVNEGDKWNRETAKSIQHPSDSDFTNQQPNNKSIQHPSDSDITSQQPNNGNQTTVSGNPTRPPAPTLRERLVKELGLNQIEKLAQLLDPDCPTIRNWFHLALHLEFNSQDRDALQRAYVGGGNPALFFFNSLQTRSLPDEDNSISGLIQKCKDLQREDVVRYIKSQMKSETKISDIPHSMIVVLAEKLAEKRHLKSWKNLACCYGYSNAEIDRIALEIKTSNEYSPTVILFKKIQFEREDATIGLLIDILGVKMQRYDVVRQIENFF